MSNFFSRGNVRTYVNADIGAGTDFAVLNFDLSDAPETWIDGIEASFFCDTADDANLTNGVVRIFRNARLDNSQSLGNQLAGGGIQTFWELRNKVYREKNIDRDFSTPFVLDTGFRYSIVAFWAFSAALATTASVDLFVRGRIALKETQEYFGKTR